MTYVRLSSDNMPTKIPQIILYLGMPRSVADYIGLSEENIPTAMKKSHLVFAKKNCPKQPENVIYSFKEVL